MNSAQIDASSAACGLSHVEMLDEQRGHDLHVPDRRRAARVTGNALANSLASAVQRVAQMLCLSLWRQLVTSACEQLPVYIGGPFEFGNLDPLNGLMGLIDGTRTEHHDLVGYLAVAQSVGAVIGDGRGVS